MWRTTLSHSFNHIKHPIHPIQNVHRQLLQQIPQRTISNETNSNSFFQQMYTDLSESSLVATTQRYLESVHDWTHLPWWATIIVSTVTLRLIVTLPLAIYQVTLNILMIFQTKNETIHL